MGRYALLASLTAAMMLSSAQAGAQLIEPSVRGREAAQSFAKLDQNRDGAITLHQIDNIAQAAPALFKVMDRDGNGLLDRREFISSGAQGRAILFERADVTNDERLSPVEFERALDSQSLRRLDVDNDQTLTLAELRLGWPDDARGPSQNAAFLDQQPRDKAEQSRKPVCWFPLSNDGGLWIMGPVTDQAECRSW